MNLNKVDQIYQNFTEPYAATDPERPTRDRIVYYSNLATNLLVCFQI